MNILIIFSIIGLIIGGMGVADVGILTTLDNSPLSNQSSTSIPMTTLLPDGALTPTSTITSPITPTITSTIIPTITRTQVSGEYMSIVGTWSGTYTVPFIASASYQAVFNADNSAIITATVNAPGYDNVHFSQAFTWSDLGNGHYKGTYGSKSLDFIRNGDKLTATVNPYKLGLTGNQLFDINANIELRKN